MAFEEQLPEWEAEGTQPPKTKRVEGWQPTEKPPAAWFNWLFNRTYKVLRELQQKAAEKEDVQLALQTAQQAEQTANQAASDLASHLNEKATQTKLGHVIVDNKTIKSTDGVISTKFRGALVYTTYFQAIPNEVVTKIAWTDVVNDTDSFFNPSNPTRLTIPSGVSKVVVKAHVVFLANATGRRYVSIIKNDSAAYNGRPSDLRMAVTDTNTSQVVVSGVIDVSTGDYFEVVVYQNSGVSLNLDRGIGNLWFSLEVIE